MGNQLNSCTFLRACITGALRLLPQFAGIPTRRELTDGINVDGHQSPEETIVGTPTYHNDQRCFVRTTRPGPRGRTVRPKDLI
ncbi:unnamed protein product [Penicillium salamii]|nr:unnamed protein product [Penicillium salamii]